MRTPIRLLILLIPWLTGCEAVRTLVYGRSQPADTTRVRRPAVNTFLNGRPSLSDERAAAQPAEDALRRKNIRFGDDVGYPWAWPAPSTP
jgi:hypothetical protein